MANTLQGLVLRIPNGVPLTPQQGDNNLQLIQAFVNALAAAIAASLNPDGTLTAGALNSLAQIANLPIFADSFAAATTLPTGTFATNVYTVPNPNITAYTPGMMVQFLASAANTGASSVNINSLGNVAILKSTNQPLIANDIIANQIVKLIYDGANFQMMDMTKTLATTSAAGPVVLAANSDLPTNTNPQNAVSTGALSAQRFVSSQFPLPSGTGQVANVAHGLPGTPNRVDWFLICTATDSSSGFGVGETASVYAFSDAAGSNAPTFMGGANTTNVYLSVSNTTTNLLVANKGTGVSSIITLTKWKAFCVASMI